MKKILCIFIIVASFFLIAGCSNYCAYCKNTKTSTEEIPEGKGWVKVYCEGCGTTYYMKKLEYDD